MTPVANVVGVPSMVTTISFAGIPAPDEDDDDEEDDAPPAEDDDEDVDGPGMLPLDEVGPPGETGSPTHAEIPTGSAHTPNKLNA